jgi:diadenosine tetraphosphate (Ap4A) HIT family hydrolase
MRVAGCLSCDTLRGTVQVPGGIVAEDAYWAFFCQSRPLMVPGRGFIVLKRHCEHLSEITLQEAASLGPMMRRTAQVVMAVLQPVKVHFGLYAEGVKHIAEQGSDLARDAPHVLLASQQHVAQLVFFPVCQEAQ